MCRKEKKKILSEYPSDWGKSAMDREGFTRLNKKEMMLPPETLLGLHTIGL